MILLVSGLRSLILLMVSGSCFAVIYSLALLMDGNGMSDYHFELPLYGIAKPTKTSKNPALSVNWYRNAYYRDSNNAKKEFKRLMREQLKHFDAIEGKVTIKYVYWSKSTRSSDIDNFVGTVKKFFQDALVECGLLPDDNFNIIVGSDESYGGVDRDNPRVDAYITVLTDSD